MVVRLINKGDLKLARQLVEANGFHFEENYDVLLGVFESGDLIATAARDRNVFKMICIRDSWQGGSLLGELVTELLRSSAYSEIENYFVFTRPDCRFSFQQLNFNPLVTCQKVCLLEYGNGLQHYLKRNYHLVREGQNGAVVVNCNPFTLGHQYLIEEAAAKVDHLYVFIVREDSSLFPFEVRFQLVQEGTRHLKNVSLLDTSDYAVSHVTFPSYFLKGDDDVQQLQMELDLLLFAKKIAPFFHICQRFIGTEPYCRTTRVYSEAMHRVLAPFAIETVQMDRKQSAGIEISAYRVREALKNEAYESLKELVPATTLDFLRSVEARDLRKRVIAYQERH